MRQRTCAVQVRVSEKEKQYICRNARRCGLSLSAYLRKCSLGKDVYSAVPPVLYRAYSQLLWLQQEWTSMPPDAIAEQMQTIAQAMMQTCFRMEKEGDAGWQ